MTLEELCKIVDEDEYLYLHTDTSSGNVFEIVNKYYTMVISRIKRDIDGIHVWFNV